MSDAPHDHLTDDELSLLTEGDPQLSTDRAAHGLECPNCRKRADGLREQQRKLDALRRTEASRPGPDCPERDSWWMVARGTGPRDQAQMMLAHAARCAHCSTALRQTIGDLEAEIDDHAPTLDLPSSSAAGQEKLARNLTEAARLGPHTGTSRFRWTWAVAAAGIMAIASAAGLFLLLNRPEQVNGLLAQAYQEHRELELRFPEAGYGPIRVERGTSRNRSLPLAQAEATIAKELGRHPEEARWLQANGRALLLEWRPEEAITEFRKAQAQMPADPSLLSDLSAAYFEKAQISGTPADFETALDLLSQAMEHNPRDPVMLFNRAVVLDHLSRYDQAIQAWNEFLQVEPSGGWTEEARSRLADVKERSR